MLIIRRRAGESLLIGDNVEIEILELGPGHVKLGIRAPREITVLRKEVLLTQAENRAAAARVSVSELTGLVRSISQLSSFPSSHTSPPAR